ncbi:MAG: hypothetical protein NTW80_08175, partial [Deltaproteobacteria bacterium]|nr:hypothetical protein [Deltaproteobacteria bacterium]
LGLVLPKDSRLLKESRTAPKLVGLAHQSLELLPPDFKQRFDDTLQKWRKGGQKRTGGEQSASGGMGDARRLLEDANRSLRDLQR